MKGYGIAMGIAGFLLAIGALLMGSTVAQEVPYSVDLPSLTRTQEMHNLPKAQLQLLLFLGGCALFVGGIIMGSIAQLGEVLAARFGGELNAVAPGGVSPIDHETASVADPETIAAQEAARQEWVADSKKYEKQFAIGAFALIAVVAMLVVGANMASRSKAPAPVSAAAEITADNLEMLADNLEAQATDAMTELDAAPR